MHIGERGQQYGGSSDGTKNWLMLKKRDSSVVEGYEAIDRDVSVKTGRSLAEIAGDGGGDPREMRRARSRGETPPATNSAAGEPARAPAPMLATSADRAFSREGWFFELKYDGIRAMVSVAGEGVRITGRRGNDETVHYPEAQAIRAGIRARQAIVDGELVVLDADGRPSFERLQQRINVSREADARRLAVEHPVTFVAFDLVQLDGRDLMATELRIRKKTLRETIVDAPHILFAEHVERDGVALFEEARKNGIEGIVAKRADSLYRPGLRTPDWVKIKSWRTQSCVIAGYTAGRGRRSNQLGALILAIQDNGRLKHCGQVGTGFNDKTLQALKAQLAPLIVDKCQLDTTPRTTEPATWVKPELICEVRFSEWTNEGMLRHPAFVKLRPDQTLEDTIREQPTPVPPKAKTQRTSRTTTERPPEDSRDERRPAAESPAGKAPSHGASAVRRSNPCTPRGRPSPETISAKGSPGGSVGSSVAGGDEGPPQRQDPDSIEAALKTLGTLHGNARWEIAGRRLPLTNLDKVLWPADGLTKRDMIEYYVRMAPYMIPYLQNRPLSMQVFPDGIDGKSFWRKDKPAHAPAWIEAWTYHGEKTKTYIVVNEVATLAWVANAGVIDLHPWHSRIDEPGNPDWAVFDLDPFEPATFQDVINIAKLVKAALDHYGMHGVVKTSGQTGLQIYVPIRRGPDYAAVRGWVEEVGKAIDQAAPGRVSWEWAVAKRTGRIRIDYTQNIINKTLAAPYSLRPAPGAPVSTPIAWDELDDPQLRPDRWNIATIAQRIEQVGDLFAPALHADQDLPA